MKKFLAYLYALQFKVFKFKNKVFIYDSKYNQDLTGYKDKIIYTAHRNRLLIHKSSNVIGGLMNFVYDSEYNIIDYKDWFLLRILFYIKKIYNLAFIITFGYLLFISFFKCILIYTIIKLICVLLEYYIKQCFYNEYIKENSDLLKFIRN